MGNTNETMKNTELSKKIETADRMAQHTNTWKKTFRVEENETHKEAIVVAKVFSNNLVYDFHFNWGAMTLYRLISNYASETNSLQLTTF